MEIWYAECYITEVTFATFAPAPNRPILGIHVAKSEYVFYILLEIYKDFIDVKDV